MQPSRPQPRAPGSFAPLPGGPSNSSGGSGSSSMPPPPPPRASRPQLRRVESSGSEDSTLLPPISISKSRPSQSSSPVTPVFPPSGGHSLTAHANSSSSSLHHNFSRPGNAGRSVTQTGSSSPLLKSHHVRKHSATQGLFDSSLPSTSTSNLSQIAMAQNHHPPQVPTVALTASQIAAQAAIMSHQHQHQRHRSQTVPFPGDHNDAPRRGSGSKGPLSPPMLSLTEASAPRDSGFVGQSAHGHHDRLGGSHSSAATAAAAAAIVFPRSGRNSPNHPPAGSPQLPQPPSFPPSQLDKPLKSEKSKVKLFSRPSKISTKGETKEKPLPSPGKIGSALSALQRHNFSTSSLVDSNNPSLYSLNNSSSATIRPMDSLDDRGKEKEKKHHFLSRQKNKLKDEYHLPLSSAASNSRPTDPSAPTSLYSFNIPSSPGPNSSFAKAKKDKKYGERSDSRLESESSFSVAGDWPGPSSLPSLSQQSSMYDPVDPGKLGLHNHMSMEDAWPYLRAKLLVIFEGEDLRIPVEDLNRVAQMHIQSCIHKRSPNTMVEDLRDLLLSGFSSLDQTLGKTSEDRFIPTLVELWLFTFTSILPYLQAVFLPLDLEVSGCGNLMTAEQARDFWGGVKSLPAATSSTDKSARVAPAATALDVRRLVLVAYRDAIVLPRYDMLKTIFSRLSLEFLPSSFTNGALASPPSELILSTSPSESFSSLARPGTAMSLDPSVASYNSSSTTLLGEGSAGGRSRAISNVSFGSHGSVREQNVEDSKQLTDMVGRMLQCMSVLSSLGAVGSDGNDEANRRVVELCKMLKLNWLGRGRTGRNRRGMVGGRVRREEVREELRVA
ncbi:hypothetical protein S7711_05283 [Stachybotrys chartarum IBT 7711]|uniref:HbrB-like protein n=1 Tax=Stachybotrys chartarum (strain CBS 109288 / IBT 7711) TaxID=1280523 RepID=A0A084AGN7_STACB|nr:hypothetical protein S7711_05283 [Stachybotrys chartarum IBT 7711]KFA73719.1 hypothetical protein S40288_06268 [Stachybotrys chartarum IBT 40288]